MADIQRSQMVDRNAKGRRVGPKELGAPVMVFRQLICSALFGALIGSALPAIAHEFWIEPEKYLSS